MSKDAANGTTSTRRSFLKSGTMLAVPLAAVAAPAVVMADEELKLRLARLENEAAIREVHQRWVRAVNTGISGGSAELADVRARLDPAIVGVAADHIERPDVIEIATDGKKAVGRFHCTVEIETPITEDSTLARMAREQGGGFVRRSERRLLKVEYARSSSAWNIAKLEFDNEVS